MVTGSVAGGLVDLGISARGDAGRQSSERGIVTVTGSGSRVGDRRD